MDWQQLPCVAGGSGYEYKISIIHLSTRMKYSEIHSDTSSQTLAEVFRRAESFLPPFFVVFTDNAMSFTMRYTAHPERRTTFTKQVEALGKVHALIAKGKPWRNAFIERSNRTDNDELFHRCHFRSSEERKYYLRLYEMYYNFKRPHQGLNGRTPFEQFQNLHPAHCGRYN
jgi:transposase InsO family protein